MVNLRGPLQKAFDLRGTANGRKHPREADVRFIERAPLALKNRVLGKKQKDDRKICVPEMVSMINCLSKYDYDQSLCGTEIEAFKKCSDTHLKAYQEKQKMSTEFQPDKIVDFHKMDGDSLREYILKFPLSERKRQRFNHLSVKRPADS